MHEFFKLIKRLNIQGRYMVLLLLRSPFDVIRTYIQAVLLMDVFPVWRQSMRTGCRRSALEGDCYVRRFFCIMGSYGAFMRLFLQERKHVFKKS